MANLVLPDSNFFITCARQGRDPFIELSAYSDEWEFATCGLVMLEVCRGRKDPNVLRRFREAFSVMIFIPTTYAIWQRAEQLAWGMDRQGTVVQATDIVIATHALQADAAVLSYDSDLLRVPGLRVLDQLF
jgi:predicted nucleic acid-binding protein